MNQAQIKLYADFIQDKQKITSQLEKAIALDAKADKKFKKLQDVPMTLAEKDVIQLYCNTMYDTFCEFEEAIHE